MGNYVFRGTILHKTNICKNCLKVRADIFKEELSRSYDDKYEIKLLKEMKVFFSENGFRYHETK